MKRLLPRTLISQMIVILLAGLVVSHLIAGWIYTSDRVRAVRAIGVYAAAQRIANLAHLIDEAPEDWRERIIAAAADPRLRIVLASRPPPVPPETEDAGDLPIRAYLLDQLPDSLAASLHVVIIRPPGPRAGVRPGAEQDSPGDTRSAAPQGRAAGDASERRAPDRSGGPIAKQPGSVMEHRMHGPGPPGPAPWRRLRVTVQLADGQWLTFTMGLPDPPAPTSWQFLIAMAVMAVIVVLACFWAVRRVTAPLGIVTRAAERLGRDVNAPPIAETGTREMRQAAHAFNEMQGRLQRLLQNRTTMLAALSHDLRTPLTLLRLRIEALPDGEERERMLASIATLDAMVDATLGFARDTNRSETWRRTDVAALLASIIDDMEDAGLPVTMQPAEPVVLECQPSGLRRAVTNLLDNAVKYGVRARLALQVSPETIRIVIDDDGPGIPPDQLLRVFEPFHRVEDSRNSDTGGTGLGLAIAQSIAEAHDGTITLSNRPGGGLQAILELPRSAR